MSFIVGNYNHIKSNNIKGVKLAFSKQRYQISGFHQLRCSEGRKIFDFLILFPYKTGKT